MTTARIPTRTKRHAMDWSLALVSQGIETTIDFSEDAGWGLVVPAQDYEHALAVIRLYRTENLHWPWRKKISSHEFLFDWGALAWVFLISAFYWLGENGANLHDAGLMDGNAVSHGEWWRLFTAIFLHADLAHLAANASIGLVLLGLAMGAYGTGVGLLAAYLAGVGGNVTTILIFENHHSLGASGMVMGALGLLTVQSVSELFPKINFRKGAPASGTARSDLLNEPGRRPALQWKNPRALKYIFSGMAAGVMLFVLLGLSPESDVVAHFGGFVSGLLLGSVWMPTRRLTQNSAANIFAGVAFCLLVILTWWLALSGNKYDG